MSLAIRRGSSSLAAAGWASLQDGRLFSVGTLLARDGRVVALYFIHKRERLDALEVELV